MAQSSTILSIIWKRKGAFKAEMKVLKVAFKDFMTDEPLKDCLGESEWQTLIIFDPTYSGDDPGYENYAIQMARQQFKNKIKPHTPVAMPIKLGIDISKRYKWGNGAIPRFSTGR